MKQQTKENLYLVLFLLAFMTVILLLGVVGILESKDIVFSSVVPQRIE